MITYEMVMRRNSLRDYEQGRREFDDPNMNKLMQDKELLQEFLYHYQLYRRFMESRRVHFMFNLKFIHFRVLDSQMRREPSLSEKIEFDAEYNKIIEVLASFTKEDIKKHTVVLLYIIELAVKDNLLKLLDIMLTYVDLKTLKRDFVIADVVRNNMSRGVNCRDERYKKSFLETLKVFLNHNIDIVEFFEDGFIFNGMPEIHLELIKAGYDYSDYLSSKYLDTEVDTDITTLIHGDCRYTFTLTKEHKQVIKDEFLAHKHEDRII